MSDPSPRTCRAVISSQSLPRMPKPGKVPATSREMRSTTAAMDRSGTSLTESTPSATSECAWLNVVITPAASFACDVRVCVLPSHSSALSARSASTSTNQRGPAPGSSSTNTTSVPKTASNSAFSARSSDIISAIPGIDAGKTHRIGPGNGRSSANIRRHSSSCNAAPAPGSGIMMKPIRRCLTGIIPGQRDSAMAGGALVTIGDIGKHIYATRKGSFPSRIRESVPTRPHHGYH